MSAVAVIGLGVMGRSAAARLVAAGHDVVASDPSPRAEGAAREIGIGFAASPAEAFDKSDFALLFLPGPEQIRSVVAGDGGLLTSAATVRVVVDHSTADPETARSMAEVAGQAGIGWVDAPVLGRPSMVGNWALPCGASEGALDLCRPIFECYARVVFDVGGPGSGHTVKLLNQMMFGAINAMTAEMMAASRKLGLPPARLYEIITSSQAGTVSNLFKELGARIAEDDYGNPTFSVRLLEKDVRLGLEMAGKVNARIRLGRVVAAMNEAAIADGHGDEDSAVMWKSVDED
jgi:3-hydroxyisobutyrate dehydrogenase-like beta-hydroxyacid dehydrogenase